MKSKKLIGKERLEAFLNDWMLNIADEKMSKRKQARYDTLEQVFDVVSRFPTIDPEMLRPAARWNEDEYAFNRCSNCGWEWDTAEYKTAYCPNCGAKMEDCHPGGTLMQTFSP